MLKFAINFQTAVPVYYTLRSQESDCVASCREPSKRFRLHRFAVGRWRCDTLGKRQKDVPKALAHAQPCEHLCRLIDAAFTHGGQNAAKGLRSDLGVFQFAFEIVGSSLALRDVVNTLELTFDAICACGPGASAFCFAVLTACAGTSDLKGRVFGLSHFGFVFG